MSTSQTIVSLGITLMIPMLFAALGEVIVEQSGVINVGIEGVLLIGAFGYHYLKRASRASREVFIEHVLASGPEYNRRYAHPFEWTWSNPRMRAWFAEHAP